MNEPTILCPKCKAEIKLTEAMASPLIDAARREFANKLATEKAKIAFEARIEAKESVSLELKAKADEVAALNRTLTSNVAKLQEAQAAQAEALQLKRDLEEKAREIDLTVEKRVSRAVATVRDEAQRQAEGEFSIKVSEKQMLIDRMAKQIDEMQKKIELGSQQAQGEVLELELENALRKRFVFDSIEPVAKGVFGGDVIQRVQEDAKYVGTILWEFKRTKNWTDGWLSKLRGDQRAAKAEIAIIVSYALPETIKTFGMQEGVWVTSPEHAIPLCAVLRHALADVAEARQAGEGQETKMQKLYAYMTGSNFKHRVGAIIEHFGVMLEDLEKERRSVTKGWAKRDAQIHSAIDAAAGMYGDLQGIAGSAVGELPALDVKQLEDAKAASQ